MPNSRSSNPGNRSTTSPSIPTLHAVPSVPLNGCLRQSAPSAHLLQDLLDGHPVAGIVLAPGPRARDGLVARAAREDLQTASRRFMCEEAYCAHEVRRGAEGRRLARASTRVRHTPRSAPLRPIIKNVSTQDRKRLRKHYSAKRHCNTKRPAAVTQPPIAEQPR